MEKLKDDIKRMLKETDGPLAQMELIDIIQRLGLRSLFDKEIKEVLHIISLDNTNKGIKEDLHASAIQFRLLRQHGYKVSPAGTCSPNSDQAIWLKVSHSIIPLLS